MLRSMLLVQSSAEEYMPHGMCYLWQEHLVWLHLVSDAVTTLAYWAIPPFLVYLAIDLRRRIPEEAPFSSRKLPYDWMLVAFGIFIVACGATHAMGIWTIWEPRYWLEGGIKAVTAAASLATAIALPPLVPRVLNMVEEARDSERRRIELEEAHREQRELVEQLRELDQAKTRFFANVSHDLRTPLSLILGPVEEALNADLSAGVRERLEVVKRNARSLKSRVEDLLTVARTEAGTLKPQLESADLSYLLDELVGHFRQRAHSRDIECRLEAPPELVVRVDPDLIERAVLNLLSNAFRFTPEGGSVRCSLSVVDETDVEIVVADSGPGVPETDREAIFAPFRQGSDPGPERADGAGLGLAIVRDVASAHGGSVSVDESASGGALFTLRLPSVVVEADASASEHAPAAELGREAGAKQRSAPPPTAPLPFQEAPALTVTPEEASRNDRPSVLVVEDDPDMRQHVARILSTDYAVVVAKQGREAMDALEDFRPDLIVTDVMMPGMDGTELVDAVRDRPELAAVPILVLTAGAEEDLPERLLRSGAQDYVLKPFRKQELKARVENLLELTRTRRILQQQTGSEEERLQTLARTVARRERQLEQSVEEKKTLLRELHHRVKGNLQTISSLLHLQLRNVEDEGARVSLKESRGRVTTMALLHEKLYQAGVPDRVELSDYLRRLVVDVVRARQVAAHIETTLELEEVEVAVDDAVAVGLVVHELVSNALRHAFPDRREGHVRVDFRRRNGDALLEVADDGMGLPEDPADAANLGFDLVGRLVKQLDGTMQVETEDGTRVEIVFPLARADGPVEKDASETPTGEDR